MGKLQTGRFERLAARTYSIKGPGALVDLDETVLGVVLLERQAGMESHLMQQWDTFGKANTVGASAGNYSWVALSNPIGSQRLLVVDSWQRRENAGTGVYMSRGIPPGFAALPVSTGLDSRITVGSQSAGNLLFLHSAITSFGIHVEEIYTNGFQPTSYVLAPDGTLLWRSGAVNAGMVISVRWAERLAAPFEL